MARDSQISRDSDGLRLKSAGILRLSDLWRLPDVSKIVTYLTAGRHLLVRTLSMQAREAALSRARICMNACMYVCMYVSARNIMQAVRILHYGLCT
jgi:hypothetical protein